MNEDTVSEAPSRTLIPSQYSSLEERLKAFGEVDAQSGNRPGGSPVRSGRQSCCADEIWRTDFDPMGTHEMGKTLLQLSLHRGSSKKRRRIYSALET